MRRKRPFADCGKWRRQTRAAVCRIPCLILCLVNVPQVAVACLNRRPDDATTALDLLTAVDGHLVRVTADASYDTVAVYGFGLQLTEARRTLVGSNRGSVGRHPPERGAAGVSLTLGARYGRAHRGALVPINIACEIFPMPEVLDASNAPPTMPPASGITFPKLMRPFSPNLVTRRNPTF